MRRLSIRSRGVGAAFLAVAWMAALGAPAAHADDAATPQWVQQSLESQFHLGDSLPLRSSDWVGTHNSFNSVKEVGLALSALDPNQKLTLTQQLDAGVRQLEIDVRWFPSLSGLLSGSLQAPVVCHALDSGLGCSTEKALGPVLSEVATWSKAHPDDVVLIYLEDHLSNEKGYQTAGSVIDDTLGSLVYKTPNSTSCSTMPLSVSRSQILASGARILLLGNSCGVGSDPAWRSNVFDWHASHLEAQVENGFQGWPACGPDFTAAQYATRFTRYFEEMGLISKLDKAGGWPLTADDIAGMTKCGVNMLSLDNWSATDPRLASMIWSWAPGEPSTSSGCAVQGGDGRWASAACGDVHQVACQLGDGSWTIPDAAVSQESADATCKAADASFAPPRTGSQNQALLQARDAADSGDVWVATS